MGRLARPFIEISPPHRRPPPAPPPTHPLPTPAVVPAPGSEGKRQGRPLRRCPRGSPGHSCLPTGLAGLVLGGSVTEPSSRMEFCGLSTEQAEEGDGEGRGHRGPLSQGQ